MDDDFVGLMREDVDLIVHYKYLDNCDCVGCKKVHAICFCINAGRFNSGMCVCVC